MVRSPQSAGGGPAWTRRRVLGTGLLGVTGLVSGCSLSDPTVEAPSVPGGPPGSSSGPPSASPTPKATPTAAGFGDQAAVEQGLADLAASIGRRSSISGEQRDLLTFLRAAHAEHAQALASPEPTSRPTSGTTVTARRISASGLTNDQALDRLAGEQARAAGRYRRAAVAATGLTAVLWGSLAVAAETYAAALDNPPGNAGLGQNRELEVVSDVVAVQEMVRQQHAVIYGYQLAIGKTSVVSKERARALRDLLAHRVQRDRLIAWLNRRDADVPVAEAAYVPDPAPVDTRTAVRLIRRMETALLPFEGLWLAAAGSEADRKLALTTLRNTARTGRRWGAPVRVWPGYP